MQIKILYFAGLREALQIDRELFELPEQVQGVQALRAHLRTRGSLWAEQFGEHRALRTAVNQEMVRGDARIGDGDEVAFFPPVTGG